ncbi:MAG TPA: SwmB domain-containing protein [Pseudonocardiaceae bacterium]|nr:SwmB domain-containing protein [Pseudonocardiaceae bacterium]
MKLRRKLGTVAVLAIVAGTSVALISAGTASASGGPGGGGGTSVTGGGGGTGGGGTGGGGGVLGGGGGGGNPGGGGGGGGASVLTVVDNCGGTLQFKERVPGALTADLTEFGDPTDVWSLQATQQSYDVTTGARLGAPVNPIPGTMLPLAFSAADGAFVTTATINDTPNMTHGLSYVATRTSPSPLTCTGEGFWTDHNGSITPDPLNPTGKPDTAPALTGATEANAGTHDVLLQFDQEMLDSAQGVPDTSLLTVTVGGVARTVTGAAVRDDSPPNLAVVDLTVDGPALIGGQTVTVQYSQPSPDQPALQDLDGLLTASFGPETVPVF